MRPEDALIDMAKRADARLAKTEPTGDDELDGFVRHMTLTAELMRSTGSREEGWAYDTYWDLVLDLSTGPKRAELTLPPNWTHGEIQQCFRNSWEQAIDLPDDVTYVEGYAQTSFFPTPHAWLEDSAGRIIDLTWTHPEVLDHATHGIYLGVKFHVSLLQTLTVATGYASVFGGDHTIDHRALRQGFVMQDGIAVDTKENP